jgi:integrase
MEAEAGSMEVAKKKTNEGKMRGVFERDGRWWISWCCTEGHRHRQPIGPRKLAVQEHGAHRKEVEKARRLGVIYCPDDEWKRKQAQKRLRLRFKEIGQDFLDFAAAHKRDRCDKFRMERLLSVFGEKLVSEITPEDVEKYKANPPLQKTRRGKKKAKGQDQTPKPLAPATVNRDLATLKTTFNRAIRAGKAAVNPVKAVPMFKENNARTRCLSDAEEEELYSALPEYLRPFLTVALNTGMRWGELARLEWPDVDFYTGTLHVRESKSGEGRRIPMNRIVRETLQTVRREQIQSAQDQKEGTREILSSWVFCAPQGGFLHNFKRDWHPALRRTGIVDFHWHDTRHTAASRLVMAGVDLYTVKEILGHKTIVMTQRYSHLSPGHQRMALEKLADREAEKREKPGEQVALAVAPTKNAPKARRANYAKEMVGRGRIELPTPGFSVLCSTN